MGHRLYTTKGWVGAADDVRGAAWNPYALHTFVTYGAVDTGWEGLDGNTNPCETLANPSNP
eukprot:3783805-Pyramimonas_sp.AAC.1